MKANIRLKQFFLHSYLEVHLIEKGSLPKTEYTNETEIIM